MAVYEDVLHRSPSGLEQRRMAAVSRLVLSPICGLAICAYWITCSLATPATTFLQFSCRCHLLLLSTRFYYFMAGRVTMQPPPAGVRLMSRFGCCSQGFIFPRKIVPQVVERINKAIYEDYYIDMLLERYADTEDLARFAHFLSLLQHVGTRSSKGWGYDEHAGETWNFEFETFSP